MPGVRFGMLPQEIPQKKKFNLLPICMLIHQQNIAFAFFLGVFLW